MVSKHFLVSGQVQGVGFRNFVYQRAIALGIEGLVRNLGDGRVEVIAKGSAEAMKDLESMVGKGPAHSLVSRVLVKAIDQVTPLFEGVHGFTISEDGETPWFIDT